MQKYALLILFHVGILLERNVSCSQEDWDTYGHPGRGQESFRNGGGEDGRPQPSWPWEDALKKLGVEETLDLLRSSIQKSWQRAIRYDEFTRDWKNLKSQPLNPFVIISFIKNTTLPAVCRASLHVKEGWLIIDRHIMAFTRKKCGNLLGEGAPWHPWNIIKQDKETISFVIFVYAVALSLILIRLCSFWNFVSFGAVGYTSYILGGPKFCFRWLVLMTGAFWYVFEIVLTYPLQSALVIIAWCFWSYIVSLLKGVTGSNSEHSFGKINLAMTQQRIENRIDDMENRLEEIHRIVTRLGTEQKS
ncbi:uncharacterized protein LOC135683130 [Rhopilema esculentum]|uniref:uncharacterized protein LOC135683130 n=1 Tax=Rhopilema esculentum TaxID=499914 RepID=UPI0031CFA904